MEENKPQPEHTAIEYGLFTVLGRILTQALFKHQVYFGWEADFKVKIKKIYHIGIFPIALERLYNMVHDLAEKSISYLHCERVQEDRKSHHQGLSKQGPSELAKQKSNKYGQTINQWDVYLC